MKAAACPQGYYEEDQVTEEAMQLHHVGTTQTTTYARNTQFLFTTSSKPWEPANRGREEEEKKRGSSEQLRRAES